MRALRFALAITWVVSRLGASAAKRGRILNYKNGKFFSGAPDARVRGTAHTMVHRQWLRDAESRELDEQLCCREHNPRHEQGRTCKQQEIVEDSGHHIPHAHGPIHCRRARTGRRRDGDTSNLAHNARRFDWFPFNELFYRSYSQFTFVDCMGWRAPGNLTQESRSDLTEAGAKKTRSGANDGVPACLRGGLPT
jgi:hypothetical protein